MRHLTFVHGWGADSSFWKNITDILDDRLVSNIDLGFTKNQQRQIAPPFPSIYITHSLGTIWALKNRYPYIKALIVINGFHCFRHFICERTLRAMKERLKKNPITQMGEFWEKCDISPANSELNPERLQEGLEWLISWNAGKELGSLSCPVLVLAGGADPILPLNLMRREWNSYNLLVQEKGGHVLPWTDSAWCAGKIREFVDGLRLEG